MHLALEGLLKRMEVMDVERIGGGPSWRKQGMEVNLQGMEMLDLERNRNPWEKLIHRMGKNVEKDGCAKVALDRKRSEPHSALQSGAVVVRTRFDGFGSKGQMSGHVRHQQFLHAVPDLA